MNNARTERRHDRTNRQGELANCCAGGHQQTSRITRYAEPLDRSREISGQCGTLQDCCSVLRRLRASRHVFGDRMTVAPPPLKKRPNERPEMSDACVRVLVEVSTTALATMTGASMPRRVGVMQMHTSAKAARGTIVGNRQLFSLTWLHRGG